MREDWIECKLEECSLVLDNLRKPINSSERQSRIANKNIEELYPYYGATGQVGYIDDYLTDGEFVLLGEDAAPFLEPTKDVAYLIQGKTWVNNHAHILSSLTNNKFLLHYLNQFNYKEYVSGTTRLKLTQGSLKSIPVKLAPLPEQQAIVKKLESLFSSLDAGVADLKKAQQQLKIYRQAVLKKAFEGELTKEWRNKQNNLPSSDEISKIITDERASFYKIQLDEWEKEVEKWKEATTTHKKPTRPSKFSSPDLPTSEQESDKWSIPNGWIWTQVGEICFVTKLAGFEYSDYVKYTDDGDLPVLKAENVGNNGFKPTTYSKVDFNSVSMLKRTYLNGGELLVVFVGAGTGKVGLVPYNKKFFLGPNIGMARPYFKLNGKYLEYFYQCLLGKKLLMATVKAVAQPSLSMGSIRQTPFVMCSLEEQNEIVKQIESRLSVCDSIEQNIKESLEKAEALRQSILKRAFEGNLLNAQELAECKQAADYEPASVLLERIKAEQNKATAKPSKKKVAEPLVVAKVETPVAKISADIHAGLIAKVIKIHEENPASIDNLSHIKCEKIAHLVEYHLQIPLGRQPVKDAAGPDDYPHLKSVESRAKKAGFFNIVKKPIGYSYSSANNSGKVIDKFQSALSEEKNRQLDNLIALFLKFDLEVSEIIATTYAGWNNLILNGNANPSDEEIVYESRENWSERKLKITRERFFKAIEWMRKNEIIPTGYGAVVPFPKKKR